MKAIVNEYDVFIMLTALTVAFTFFIKVILFAHPDSKVGFYWREGWFQPILFHRFWCKKHEWVVNYPSGWKPKLFCPLCDMEEWRTNRIPESKTKVECGASWMKGELTNSIEEEDHN